MVDELVESAPAGFFGGGRDVVRESGSGSSMGARGITANESFGEFNFFS